MRRGKADTREKEKLTRAPGSRGRSGGRDQRQGSGEAASTAPEGAPAKSALTDKDRAVSFFVCDLCVPHGIWVSGRTVLKFLMMGNPDLH